jgi:hypothetical protein
MATRSHATLAAAVLCCAHVACGFEPDTTVTAIRDTLRDGTIVLRYERLPDPQHPPVEPDLSLGVADGERHRVFGDIGGIAAAGDGTIYVLDAQASEVRAFDADGRFLRTLTRQGEGPGEVSRANAIHLVGDSALWIQDNGQGMMIAVDLQGGELARVPRFLPHSDPGSIDHRGRFWDPVSHPAPWTLPENEGVIEVSGPGFLKSYDRATDASDSVFLGVHSTRAWVKRRSDGGYSYFRIPDDPRTITVVDPAGGFWQTSGTAYRIARLDERGDTVLVIEATTEPVPVTAEDRRGYVDVSVEQFHADRANAEKVAALMPAVKQAIANLLVDDEGHLWAERTVARGEPPLYDVFGREGQYLGAVTLAFRPALFSPIYIRSDRVYAVVRDSLDVPSVVRTGPIPWMRE